MKNCHIFIRLSIIVFAASCVFAETASAETFTAVSTGNWGDSTTWGGAVPPYLIATDQVVIPAGIHVTLESDLTINGLLASLTVFGVLEAVEATAAITIEKGTLTGAGYVKVQEVVIEQGGTILFTGEVYNLRFNNLIAKTFTLPAGLIAMGTLDLGSANLDLQGQKYTLHAMLIGSGQILVNDNTDLTVDNYRGEVPSILPLNGGQIGSLRLNAPVSLEADLNIIDTVDTDSHVLFLNSMTLTISGFVKMLMVHTKAGTNIVINNETGIGGDVQFWGSDVGHSQIDTLAINTGDSVITGIMGVLRVTNQIDLQSGVLSMRQLELKLDGDIVGPGSLRSSGYTSLHITTPGARERGLRFQTGYDTLYTLIVSGLQDTLRLQSNLVVSTIAAPSTVLVIEDFNLTVDKGLLYDLTLQANDGSALSILTPKGLGVTLGAFNKINFIENSQLGALRVKMDDTSSLRIGSDLFITRKLELESGKVLLDAKEIVVGEQGSILGGSNAAYVHTSSGGKLTRSVEANSSSVMLYPVGSTIGYFPASITLQTGSASGAVSVRAEEGVRTNGNTGSLITATSSAVNNTWDVSSDITSNLKMNLEVAWPQAAEVNGFDRTRAYVSHYASGKWDAPGIVSADTRFDGMVSLTRNDIQSLSPFAVFDASTTDISSEEPVVAYSVYPSPANDVLVIDNVTTSSWLTTIDIVDVQGRIVHSTEMNGSRQQINVSELTSGLYFVRLHNEHSTTTKSFVKF